MYREFCCDFYENLGLNHTTSSCILLSFCLPIPFLHVSRIISTSFAIVRTTDYGHPMKVWIKDIWKIGPMWQTKYATGVPKNWDWDWIFGRAVKTISSPGVRSRYVVSLCCQYVSGFRQICAHGQIMFNKFNYSHYLIFSYQHSLSSQITFFPPSLLLSSWKIPPLSTFHGLASLGTKCHISLASNIFACTHIMHWIKIVYRVYH